MKASALLLVLFCILCCYAEGAKAKACRRTNKKHWKYCETACSSDSDCSSKQRCLCDGDCGMSCVKQGLSCGDPPRISHGKRRVTGTGLGDTVTYRCQKTYHRRGPETRTCRAIGKWDGRTTRCRKMCTDPGDIAHGNRNIGSSNALHRVSTRIRYWCFPGANLLGTATIECTKTGEWSANRPSCELPSCGKPVKPANAAFLKPSMDKKSYPFNDIVAYKCTYGYYGVGSRIQTCTKGRWERTSFRCIPKSCGDPGSPALGSRRGYVFTFKSKVYFTCNRGHVLLGPKFRQCQSNQKWSGTTPTCQPMDCGRLPTPRNGAKTEETKTTFEGRVSFKCTKKGYELKGSRTRLCQESGKWDGTLTTCQPVECDDPGTLRYGGRNPDKDKYIFGDKVSYKCKKNFTMNGDTIIVCQENKAWTGTSPICLAPCPDPGIPVGGSRFDHDFRHKKQVRFQCRNGWELEGKPIISCNNGNWDFPAPKCLACDGALGMESGAITDKRITASSKWDVARRPSQARLNGQSAWCSGSDQYPFIEIDFGKPYKITGLATQGSTADRRWVGHFVMSTNLAGASFNSYREKQRERLFIGNTDTSTVKRYQLQSPFIARKIKIRPQTRYGFSSQYPACMRVEIFGCDLPSSCVMVGSRVFGKWGRNLGNADYYYKAYVRTIDPSFIEVDIETRSVLRASYKKLDRGAAPTFVLDVTPKPGELSVGTRVIADWGGTYFAARITNIGKNYSIRFDDGDRTTLTIERLRILKTPTFCDSK